MARLLVVEDNPTTARVLSLYLSGAGHRVREASSPAEALFEADVFQPEVIVLSASIPNESILQLLSESKEWEIRPKVVLTALRGNECDCQELLKAGVSDYVVKSSYFQNSLIEKVNRALADQNEDWSVGGPMNLERPLFKFRDRRGRGPQIPIHSAYDRRKADRSRTPKRPGGSA